MEPKEYIQERVKDQLGYYERAANRAKSLHIWMQTTIVIIGLLVPVVANLNEKFMFGADGKTVVVTILSLMLAMLTGIANFRKFGDLWLAYRTTEELLKKELYLFETGTGPYEDKDKAFNKFVESVESLISVEHERFRSIVESEQRSTKGKQKGSAPAA